MTTATMPAPSQRLDPEQLTEQFGASAESWRRWMRSGYQRRDGRVVKLEASRLGRKWQADTLAVERFMSACAGEPIPV